MVHDDPSFSRKQDTVITFRASAAFREWLQREAFIMDMSASDLIRSSVIAGIHLVKNLHGMDRLDIDDILDRESLKHTKV